MKHLLPVLALAFVGACNDEVTGLGPPSDPATEVFDPSLGVDIAQMERLPSGVYIQDLVAATGDDSVGLRTDTVWITYNAFLKTGEQFDAGVNRRFEPAAIVPGLREGMIGMRPGGRRLIVIPSELGYGARSVTRPGTVDPVIPRQSTLIFRVELLRLHNIPEDDDDT